MESNEEGNRDGMEILKFLPTYIPCQSYILGQLVEVNTTVQVSCLVTHVEGLRQI